MKRSVVMVSIALVLVGLLALAASSVRQVGAARPYEGQTIRAVVNAEYVKYSLSLIEKELYEKLGVRIETEVVPNSALDGLNPPTVGAGFTMLTENVAVPPPGAGVVINPFNVLAFSI